MRFVAAFNRQDAGAVSEMYTDDCTMMPTGSDVVQGKDSRLLVASMTVMLHVVKGVHESVIM